MPIIVPKLERRLARIPRIRPTLRRDSDGGKLIAGYAAVFYNPRIPGTEYELWNDRFGRAVERIMSGAFDRALSNDDVRGLFNHDPSLLLGRTSAGTMTLTVDTVGLKYEIKAADTSTARDVVEHLRRGDLTGSSFSFSIPDGGEEWITTTDAGGKEEAIRRVLDVTLFDVGPVSYPAYDATTAGLRATDSIRDLREAFEGSRERRRQAQLIEMEAFIAEHSIL